MNGQRMVGAMCPNRRHVMVREVKRPDGGKVDLVPVGLSKPEKTDFCRKCFATREEIEADAVAVFVRIERLRLQRQYPHYEDSHFFQRKHHPIKERGFLSDSS